MRSEPIVRTATISLLGNLVYSLYTGGVGIVSHSWWFITLAAYYVVLSITRFAVLLSHRRSKAGDVSEQFLMRFTGWLFLFLAVVLAGTTYLAVADERGIRHHEIVMITMAAYTFWKLTNGIINLVKSRKLDSAVFKILRNISFADGLVSIFSLQRSMLVSFEGMSAENITLFNGLTGSAVYVTVCLLGINLIGGKRITMAKSKLVEVNEKIAEAVADGYKKIEDGVVGGYKKIEDGVVSGYTKLEDKFIDQFLTREGETVEEAKERLKKNKE